MQNKYKRQNKNIMELGWLVFITGIEKFDEVTCSTTLREMYVYIYVCMYVCMYVWMDGWMD